MKAVNKIWMDGHLMNWDKANIHVLTPGLHYGGGAFEGIRCYLTHDGRSGVFRLSEHIDRLFYSAKCLNIDIPFSKKEIVKAVLRLVKANNIKECYLRPIVFASYGKIDLDITDAPVSAAVILWPWDVYLGGKELSAVISSHRRLSPKAVPIDAKISGYYVNSIMATTDARKRGADEAILLDDRGCVAEGPGENIFIVRKSKLLTPSLGAILPGITRDSVIRIAGDMGIQVKEKSISIKDLKASDEVFFTGTAIEITPVVRLEGKKIGKGIVGAITSKIRDEFGAIVRGRNKKYKSWLTYV